MGLWTMRIKRNAKTFWGTIVVALAFSESIKTATSWAYPFIIFSLLVVLYLSNTSSGRGYERGRYILKKYFKMGMVPYLLLFLYSIFVISINHQGIRFIKRSVGSMLIALMVVITSASLVFIFNKKAPDIICYGLLLNYAFRVVVNFNRIGIQGIIQHIKDPLNTYENIFEAHHIGFTINLLLIYYLFKRKKENKGKIIWILICMYLIMKRIAFAGLCLALLIWFVNDVVLRKKSEKKYIFILWGLTIGSFLYVAFITLYPDYYRLLMSKLGILNRFIMANSFAQYYLFNIRYIGRGYGFVSVIIPEMDIAGTFVEAIHNDILKSFIEEGFIGFCIIYYYFFIRLPLGVIKNKSKRALSCITTMLVYTFITLLTDNVLDYVSYTCALFTIYGVLHMYGVELLPDKKALSVMRKNVWSS